MAAPKSWPWNILTIVLFTSFTIVICQQSISNKRLCADKECKGTISTARALARFPGGNNPLFLSFKSGDKIDIKSKSAGDDPSLWGGEVNGQRGYFPKTYVKEMRVIVPSPNHEVDTEGNAFFNDMGKPPMPRRPQSTTEQKKDDANVKQESVDSEKDDTELEEVVDETEIEEDLADDEVEIDEDDPEWNEDETQEEEEPLENYSIEDLDPYTYEEERNRFDTEEYNAYIQQQQKEAEEKAAQENPSVKEEEKAAEVPTADAPPSNDDTEFENENETENLEVDSDVGEKDQITEVISTKESLQGDSAENMEADVPKVDIKSFASVEGSQDADSNDIPIGKPVSAGVDESVKEKEDVIDPGTTVDSEHRDSQETLFFDSEKVSEGDMKEGEGNKEEDLLEKENNGGEKEGENKEEEQTGKEGKQEEMEEKQEENGEENKGEKGEEERADRISDDAISETVEDVKPKIKVEQPGNQDPVTFPMDDEEEEEDYEIPVMETSDISQKDSPNDQEQTEGKVSPDEFEAETKVTKDIKDELKEEAIEVTPSDSAEEPVDKADDVEIKTTGNEVGKEEKGENKEESTGDEQPQPADTDIVQLPTSENVKDENEADVLPEEDQKDRGDSLKIDEKSEDFSGKGDDIDVEVGKSSVKEEIAEGEREVKPEDKVLDESKEGGEHSNESEEHVDVAPEVNIDDKSLDDTGSEEKIGVDEKSLETKTLPVDNEIDSQPRADSKSEDSVTPTASETKDSEETTSTSLSDDSKATEFQTVGEKDSTDVVDDQPIHSDNAAKDLGQDIKDVQITPSQEIHQTLSSSQVEDKEVQQIVPLESSMQETVAKPDISETPSLATQAGKTPTSDENEKSDDGFETIVEGGTTIIIDPNGNLVTPALTEGKTEDANKVDVTESKAEIAPSKSLSEEGDSLSSEAETAPVSNNSTDTDGKTPSESQPKVDIKANVYQSVDFNSRRVLSVSHKTQVPTSTSQEGLDSSDVVTGKEHPDQQQPKNTNVDENEKKEVRVNDGFGFLTPEEAAKRGRQFNEDLLVDRDMSTQDGTPQHPANNANSIPQESTTVSSHQPEPEIPQPPTESRPEADSAEKVSEADSAEKVSEADSAEKVSESYETDSVVGRKIDDARLQEEENMEDAAKARQYYKTMFDSQIRNILNRLPPSIQNLLEQEPLGLSPTMAVITGVVTIATFFFTCLFTCLCSSNGKKANIKKSLDVIQALEEKLQLAIKEKENIEDSIEDNQQEVIKMKEEVAKGKRESGKMTQDLQTVKLHNETMKKQIKSLEEEIEDLRDNAQSSQGEAKQSNKKTKEMQKQIKTLEEKDQKATQEITYLSSELKLKEEEISDTSSRLEGMSQHISQLETSKEQLLSEAEDWKEKVNDLNERGDQREEEFKQMQESLSFKESELEVLKDCFLQLKSFESEEEDSSKVEDKLHSMMDVSKINATLRSVEEERDSLSNKLQIESEARTELEEQMKKSQERVESCMSDKMKAERQCQEAQTKLSVLSSYFKEKEMQLQRELGEQEALKKQNQNKLVSADETTKSVQQESEAVRTQNESLKRELANSERDFRAQIAANEKKAHENWLAARAAERELKEARHEAGVMRQKLTDLERRQMMGPGGLIRPLPTRGMPPPGMMNGPPPPPPGMDRSSSRGSLPHPPHHRDEDFPISPRGGPPPPMDRRGPLPPGMRPPPPDGRSPPPRLPPHDARSPPPRMPPPGMMDGRGSPPFDRRPPPPHLMDRDRDRMTPPFRLPPPDMLPPPHMRDGPPPPHHPGGRGGSMSPENPHGDPRQDPRYRDHPYRNAPPPDRGLRPSPRQPLPPLSPRQPPPDSPRQQQSQV